MAVAVVLGLCCFMPSVARRASAADSPLREDGALPVARMEGEAALAAAAGALLRPMDPVRRRFGDDAPLPLATDLSHARPSGLDATPGAILLAERTRQDQALDGLAGWLTHKRPSLLLARYGQPFIESGSRVISVPLAIEIDFSAYADLADEFCRRVTDFTGIEGAEVRMPVHAEFLADDLLFLGPPLALDPPRNAEPVVDANEAPLDRPVAEDAGFNAITAESWSPYEGGMNLLVCLDLDLAEGPTEGAWPGEAIPVWQYRARWRVFDLPEALASRLAREVVERHAFHVRAEISDAAGAKIETPPSSATSDSFVARGLFLSPEAGTLVIMPVLLDREAHSWTGRTGAPVDRGSLLPPLPDPLIWRRLARFYMPDDALALAEGFRCLYGTHCRRAPDARPCAAHP